MAAQADIILKSNNRNGKVVTRNAVDRAWDAVLGPIQNLFAREVAATESRSSTRKIYKLRRTDKSLKK